MSFTVKIWLFPFVLLAFLYHQCIHETSVVKTEDAVTSAESLTTMRPVNDTVFNECSEVTRQVLITHCGSCHQSTLATHRQGAIAVFDLDKNANWHEDLSIHNLKGITQRTQNKNTITDTQKEAITLFIELKTTWLNQ